MERYHSDGGNMNYYEKFKGIHELLKSYNCKPTYSCFKEYEEETDTDIFYYETFREEKLASDSVIKEQWKEEIVGKLDVTIKTKIREAETGEIRFDITYSDKAKKYSMYISLPTSRRSIPLNKNSYSSQDEALKEVNRYINYAKAKRNKAKVINREIEQICLF
jgi:hypothetical protein